MQKRGLLTDDLPPSVVCRMQDAHRQLERGEWEESLRAYKEVRAVVAEIEIGNALVAAKMTRLNRTLGNAEMATAGKAYRHSHGGQSRPRKLCP